MLPGRTPRGMTLLEMMIALGVIAVAVLALISALLSNMVLTDTNRDETLALHYARAAMSALESAQNSDVNFNGAGDHTKGIFAKCAPGAGSNPFDVTVFDVLDMASTDTNTFVSVTTDTSTSTSVVTTTSSPNPQRFYGQGFIYFPVAANAGAYYPSPNATDTDMQNYYGNLTFKVFNGQAIATQIKPPLVAAMGSVVLNSTGDYILLPVTIRIVWQDLKSGDPANGYLRFVDYHGQLAKMH
jgi:prepilin-type N-terminal cleavage/methylation domain-containing protein